MYGEVARDLKGHGSSYTDPVTGVTVLWTGNIRVSPDAAIGPYIALLYERLGSTCASEMTGAFAFAIHDPRSDRVILARDVVGNVPLYYAHGADGRLVFGTRIEHLLPKLDPPELEPDALLDFLTFFWSLDDKTFFKGIRLVPPGSVYVDGKIEEYFTFEHRPERRDVSEWCDAIVDTLTEVVSEIDGPGVGCYLSGGIDSSTIAALLTKLRGDAPKSFVGAFPDYAGYDEAPYGQIVADDIGSEFTRITVSPAEFPKVFASIMETIEEPKCHPPVFSRFLVDAAVQKAGCRTMVSGRGADELFTGYDAHKTECLAGHKDRRTVLGSVQLANLLRPEFIAQTDYDPQDAYDTVFAKCPGASLLERVLAFDIRTLMANWLVLDHKISRRFDITPVAPFLDRRVIELALSIPIELKCAGDKPKDLLKRAVAGLIPESVIKRKKVGFRTPMGEMFRDGLEPFVRDSLNERQGAFREIFNPAGVNALIEEHFTGERNRGWQLWALLCINEWCGRYIDRAVDKS